ncbi:hypothetical protein NDN08_002902 [Rhodosorus marinus]|uniref:Uncharacterized protein n=1 Tax=Rhodosorus marinus TaxID=101924 RepID=A0AAV8UV60_9RHOD|nr:hypothetical protein NDN08_002902 [Rhodosorus marinus]
MKALSSVSSGSTGYAKGKDQHWRVSEPWSFEAAGDPYSDDEDIVLPIGSDESIYVQDILAESAEALSFALEENQEGIYVNAMLRDDRAGRVESVRTSSRTGVEIDPVFDPESGELVVEVSSGEELTWTTFEDRVSIIISPSGQSDGMQVKTWVTEEPLPAPQWSQELNRQVLTLERRRSALELFLDQVEMRMLALTKRILDSRKRLRNNPEHETSILYCEELERQRIHTWEQRLIIVDKLSSTEQELEDNRSSGIQLESTPQ